MPGEASGEYEKLKAAYAEKYAEKTAGAAARAKTYGILIRELERDCSGLSGVAYDGIGYSPNVYVDGVHDQAIRSSSSLERWKVGKEEAEKDLAEASEAIKAVGNDCYRLILELKYLDLLEWKAIASAIGYSVSTAMHMKQPALAALHDVMPVEYRIPIYKAT